MLKLEIIKRTDQRLLQNMKNHYSKPKGFVGRNICYAILFDGLYYGGIVGGSATKHLPGRNEYFGFDKNNVPLNNIVNNIFFHICPINEKYPIRNFSTKILIQFQKQICKDWNEKYGDKVIGLETLVELPRTGNVYLRSGWKEIGRTIGYTCKRTSGKGTDSWTGKRIWDTENLRPKRVFAKLIN